MIYIASDLHGYQQKWIEQIQHILKYNDVIIIAGDFGFGFFGGAYYSEEEFYDWIAEQNYTVLVIDGNHENFDKLLSYPITEIYGGKAHKIRNNIYHLMRGEIYNIDGQTIFTMGGGYSLDKLFRTEGVSWWHQEMPSKEEYDNAQKNLEKYNYSVDYIITHTCPYETLNYLATFRDYRIKNNVKEEYPLNFFLDYVRSKTEYKKYYFGHLHIDAELWRNQTAVFNCIRELETGKIARQWDTYEGF